MGVGGGEEAEQRLDALLARLSADAATLARLPLRDLDGVRASAARRVLRQVSDHMQVATSSLLAAVEADGRWAAGGTDRTLPGWVARREGIAYGAARRELALGRALTDLPSARDAVLDGAITAGHADVLADVALGSPARQAALAGDLADRNEEFLVGEARRLPVDEFRKVMRRWAVAVDDETAEREHTAAVARESLAFARRRDGVAFTGFLTHEHGELLTAAVRAVAGVPAKDDERSLEQRQAAALTGVARLVLDKGLSARGAQIRPHLNVLVPYETLERLATGGGRPGPAGTDEPLLAPAELASGEPLPRSVLARIACDSEVTRIVLGPESEVLDVGRAERTYTRQLRRAVVARDKHCQFPGCSAPPSLGEVHHITWWARQGATSVANGVLLCWHHHEVVHGRDLAIRRRAGGHEFTYRDGTPVAPSGYGEPGAPRPPTDRLRPGPRDASHFDDGGAQPAFDLAG